MKGIAKKANIERELQRRRRGAGTDYHMKYPVGGALIGAAGGAIGGALEGSREDFDTDSNFFQRFIGADEVKEDVKPLARAAQQAIERGAQGAAAGGGIGVLAGGVDQHQRQRSSDQYRGYTTEELERLR